MNKLSIIVLFFFTTLTLRTHDTHNLRNSHFLDQALCIKRGGVLCGRINKDCCLVGCQTNFFVHQSCQDGKFLNTTSDKTPQNLSQAAKTPAVNTASESKVNITETAKVDTKVDKKVDTKVAQSSAAASNATTTETKIGTTRPETSSSSSGNSTTTSPTNNTETSKPATAPEEDSSTEDSTTEESTTDEQAQSTTPSTEKE